MNTYIRPVMEYGVQAWSPWLNKDVEKLQRIYHRATKLVEGLHHLPYAERLKQLNLFDFQYRKLRGDLILLYRIIHNDDHPLRHLFIRSNTRETRSHDCALEIPHSRINCRRYFFTVRVCFIWNILPEHVVNSANLSSFTANLDTYMCSYTITEPSH